MAEAPRRGLGRGLAALLGEAETLAAPGRAASGAEPRAVAGLEGPPTHAPVELLRRNPDQPRRKFGDAELQELTDSVRQRGVLQPILVRPAPGAPGEWQIVAGERRWRAAQRAGLHEVPILVRDLSDTEVLEIGIVENVQRADLDPIEEALGYFALIDRFGHTQAETAQLVGKSRSHVTNALRLLQTPDNVQDHLIAGRLSAGHARAIASAPDAARLADSIVERGLSVRQAEALGRQAQSRAAPRTRAVRPSAPPAAGGAKHPDIAAIEHDTSEALGLDVSIEDRAGAGEVRIAYRTLEQLDEVLRRLAGL